MYKQEIIWTDRKSMRKFLREWKQILEKIDMYLPEQNLEIELLT